MNLETSASKVVEPGPWLQVKRFVPARFHPLLEPIESALYESRGVPFLLEGKGLRVIRGCPMPFTSAFRPPSQEALEDLAFMSAVLGGLGPGDRFLDAGAHFGLYALGGALRVGSAGRVVAFEPTPASAALVRRNAALNGFSSRIQVESVAVTDGEGTIEFIASGTSCQNSIASYDPFRAAAGAKPETIVVRTVALDPYFDPAFRTVAKIDVEGAELAVLRGAPKLLASPARIFVELHAWAWSSPEEGWAELTAIARAAGRSVRSIDGTPIDRPSHQRVELARAS